MYLFSNEAFINEPVIHLVIIFKQCHLNALYWYHFSCSDVYIDPRNVGFASFRIFIRRLTVCELIITAGLWTHRYVTRKKTWWNNNFVEFVFSTKLCISGRRVLFSLHFRFQYMVQLTRQIPVSPELPFLRVKVSKSVSYQNLIAFIWNMDVFECTLIS